MSFLRRARRSRAQTTSEYMLMIAVVSIGVMIALEWFSDPNGVVQQAGNSLADNFEGGLSNDGNGMRVR